MRRLMHEHLHPMMPTLTDLAGTIVQRVTEFGRALLRSRPIGADIDPRAHYARPEAALATAKSRPMTLTPEQRARERIDALLGAAGWIIQDNADFNRNAGEGVAVREFLLPNGPCDYLLFVAGRAAGVIEAKKSGVTLSSFAEQAARYMVRVPDYLARWADRSMVIGPAARVLPAVTGGEASRRSSPRTRSESSWGENGLVR